ncbi:hypothetical protein BT69DRAFT_590933 [Atractiella rhizophila]|nr:hypothetical protein BT69DRAFT_590933 [Atractiella rhizophila]
MDAITVLDGILRLPASQSLKQVLEWRNKVEKLQAGGVEIAYKGIAESSNAQLHPHIPFHCSSVLRTLFPLSLSLSFLPRETLLQLHSDLLSQAHSNLTSNPTRETKVWVRQLLDALAGLVVQGWANVGGWTGEEKQGLVTQAVAMLDGRSPTAFMYLVALSQAFDDSRNFRAFLTEEEEALARLDWERFALPSILPKVIEALNSDGAMEALEGLLSFRFLRPRHDFDPAQVGLTIDNVWDTYYPLMTDDVETSEGITKDSDVRYLPKHLQWIFETDLLETIWNIGQESIQGFQPAQWADRMASAIECTELAFRFDCGKDGKNPKEIAVGVWDSLLPKDPTTSPDHIEYYQSLSLFVSRLLQIYLSTSPSVPPAVVRLVLSFASKLSHWLRPPPPAEGEPLSWALNGAEEYEKIGLERNERRRVPDHTEMQV